jgi:hypothetical protein
MYIPVAAETRGSEKMHKFCICFEVLPAVAIKRNISGI